MQNPENVQKSQGKPEILSRAHPGGPGLRREKDEKMPDPPPQAERPGERKNVSGEGREPSPGRKLPPRATTRRRSAPSTPCSDQTRGPEPSPGDQGRGDPKILWVNLLKARTIGKIPKKNPSNPPQSHPSPEPASIPWHPLRAGRKGWGKVGGAIRIPAGPPAKGWRFGRIGPRARQLARRERGKRATW